MDTLFELYERTRLPPDMIIPTHVNRLHPDVIEQGIEYTKLGGVVDLSTLMRKEEGTMTGLKTEYAVMRMLDEGAPIENITISSDGNVPMAMRDEDMNQIGLYIAPLDFNRREIRDIVNNGVAPLSEALKMVTTNVARVLGIKKGRIKKEYDADIVIAESIDSLKVKEVYAKGTRMVKNGKSIFQGHYQEDPYKHMYN
jgi:beta-aspartyl-dipeptidase (metallo-type)